MADEAVPRRILCYWTREAEMALRSLTGGRRRWRSIAVRKAVIAAAAKESAEADDPDPQLSKPSHCYR